MTAEDFGGSTFFARLPYEILDYESETEDLGQPILGRHHESISSHQFD
jgi:hypothetical protein